MNQPDPSDGSDDLQSAIALHQAGRMAEAERLYLRVLEREPDEPDALNLFGVILQERGEIARSIELISRAVELDPDFPEALTNLARAQYAAGQAQVAADNAARAEWLDPELAEAPLILCRALLELGDHAAAADAGFRAAALAPDNFDARACLGLALENLQNWREAAEAYQAALDLKPDRLTMKVALAVMLSEIGQHERAIQYFREAAAMAPDELPPHTGLAVALQRSRDIPGSVAACHRAIELAPERADIWRVLGNNYDALGRFDEAAESYRRSLVLAPDSAEARRSLAKIGRLEAEATEIARLRAVFENAAAPARDRTAAGFGLGILFDRIGAYDDAFASFKAANDLDRANRDRRFQAFDADRFRRDIGSLIAGFDPTAWPRACSKGNPSELPVFIVGMFRSGTTLVEQIIASHKRVHGAGETMDIDRIVGRLAKRQPGVDPRGVDPRGVDPRGAAPPGVDSQPGIHPVMWDPAEVDRETAAHIAHLRCIGGDADRVVDKLPDNITMLGHIALLFPRSRVIYCRRDPRDSCLSSYFQQFEEANPWSSDLASCAVRAYELARVMKHWQATLPLRILEVQYEDLVADLEGHSCRLIDFLGLEWDPACLEFHKTDRMVMSASQWQVRQPIYSTSVGRWRRYRKHLGPLMAGLKDLVSWEQEDDALRALAIDDLLQVGRVLVQGPVAIG